MDRRKRHFHIQSAMGRCVWAAGLLTGLMALDARGWANDPPVRGTGRADLAYEVAREVAREVAPEVAPEVVREDVPWAQRGDELPQVHARLGGLAGEAFATAASDAASVVPRETIGALLLWAGPIPPGLTVAAARRRETMRSEALELLAERLTGADSMQWGNYVIELLEGGSPGDSPRERSIAGDLACAAFSALSELVLDAERRLEEADEEQLAGRRKRWKELRGMVGDFASSMADALAPEREPRVRFAAREALRRLYGLRFEGPEDFESYIAEGGSGETTRRALLASSDLAEQRLLELIELDPSKAREAWKESASQAVHRRVPSILGDAVSAGRWSRDEAIEILWDGFEQEVDHKAFHAQLSVLLQLAADVPADDESTRRLRSELLERSLQADSYQAWSVLHGLTRVPLPELSKTQTLERVVRLFDRLINDWRPLDGDVVAQGLADVRSFIDRVGPHPELTGLWRSLRFLLVDYAHPGSLEVRRAAARTVGRMVREEQLGEFLGILESAPENELIYDLIASSARIADRFYEREEAQERLAKVLIPFLDHPSLDVRRITLDVLGSEPLSPVVSQNADLPALLVARMSVEESADLLLDELHLLARFERPRLVAELLDTPALNKLAADPRGLDELARTLRRLAGSDPLQVLQAARGLSALEQDETVVARTQHALELAFSLPESLARELEPKAHGEILTWLRELRSARGEAVAIGLQDEQRWVGWCRRALDVHVPLAPSDDDSTSDCAAVHLEALLCTDLLVVARRDPSQAESLGVGPEGIDQARVIELYRSAHELCASSPLDGAQVLRDWARMLLAVDSRQEALSTYAKVAIELEAEPNMPRVLDAVDLRRFARLVQEADPASEDLRRLGFLAIQQVVSDPDWVREPLGLRQQDLKDLARAALGWGDSSAMASAAATIDRCVAESEPDGSEESRAELQRLRARLEERTAPPPAPEDSDSKDS